MSNYKLNKNTVFVIGAGASKEANLPTGYELKNIISDLLDIRFDWDKQTSGDHLIKQALHQHLQEKFVSLDINPYLDQAHFIKNALPLAISIDNFLDAHKNNEKIELCGKLAIVRSILAAEKKSLLYYEKNRVDSTISYKGLEKTWYIPFFQLLTENCRKDDIKERLKAITLIIFNYDRCVEHYIYHALQSYYRMTESESAEIVDGMNIYHPYGVVGTLPWMSRENGIDFGADPNPPALLHLSKQIKTFTEGTDPSSSEIIEIKSHMNKAARVAFIGFAFHKLNMELIMPQSEGNKNKRKIQGYATTYDISLPDQKVVESQVSQLYGGRLDFEMANLKCGAFFKEYWRSLSF